MPDLGSAAQDLARIQGQLGQQASELEDLQKEQTDAQAEEKRAYQKMQNNDSEENRENWRSAADDAREAQRKVSQKLIQLGATIQAFNEAYVAFMNAIYQLAIR